MKDQIPTLEVIAKLRALHQHYIALVNTNKEKGELKKVVKYADKAEAVENCIHEVELISGMID